jgi:hypothetical protein
MAPIGASRFIIVAPPPQAGARPMTSAFCTSRARLASGRDLSQHAAHHRSPIRRPNLSTPRLFSQNLGGVLDCPANRPTKVMSMIPAEKMIVLWDTNDKDQITKLAVEHIEHQPASMRALPNSQGSCSMGWLDEENPIDNPIGLFSYLATSCGFIDRQTAMHALRQFGKVEGQSWAKEILKRSGELDEDDEDE